MALFSLRTPPNLSGWDLFWRVRQPAELLLSSWILVPVHAAACHHQHCSVCIDCNMQHMKTEPVGLRHEEADAREEDNLYQRLRSSAVKTSGGGKAYRRR
ncbi:hypothetical protein GUJ93_ZPchr0014g46573 [Zizania palustris]|uniref:Uncharacterized protein n=1 Tax=Zizania palustris TaxID=103762 RepID=A0A8J5TER0_ZIZPA|nr:hypothetical protein GUJ93_ZPchr0014g46687 [Zizania palustris]KAG8082165.1 hypothetical protein GUJ93_ZPchr0014g46573 [Zizania palustris]